MNICGEKNSYVRRFWYSFAALLFCFYFVGVTNVYNHKKGVTMTKNDELIYDAGFDFGNQLFSKDSQYEYYSNISNIFTVVFTAYNVIFCMIVNPRHTKLRILNRFMIIITVLFGMRNILSISTVLPRPWIKGHTWPTCPDENYDWGNPFIEPLKFYFASRTTCYDLFYSGHTIFLTISSLIFHKYSKNNYLVVLHWLIFVFNVVLISITRNHYLIDILAAFVTSILLWIISEYQLLLQRGIFYEWDKNANPIIGQAS